MFKNIIKILSFLILLSTGCTADERTASIYYGGTIDIHPKDWLTDKTPASMYNDDYIRADFYQVTPTKSFQAVKKLKDKQYIQLSISVARNLIGFNFSDISPNNNKKPYLIRGISDNVTSGEIVAIWFPKSKKVSVVFTSMGSGGGTYSFVPLVVYLPNDPLSIWVTTTSQK